MSRPSSVAGSLAGNRSSNLTLTEELEKLEQSITLTLQEIDRNFSRAHRIVTSSILPVVEQYARHSEAVWEGSRFWKQFFEASANVSLSGYEEQQQGEDGKDGAEESTVLEGDSIDETATTTTTTTTTTTDGDGGYDDEGPSTTNTEDSTTGTTTPPGLPIRSSKYDHDDDSLQEDSLLSSPSVAQAHSTPRMPDKSPAGPSAFSTYSSPYEKLKAEVRAAQKAKANRSDKNNDDDFDIDIDIDMETTDLSDTPATPRATLYNTNYNRSTQQQTTPGSSPFGALPSDPRHASLNNINANANNDPLLHRMLDKTYRIAATPHSTRRTLPPPHSSAIRNSSRRGAAAAAATTPSAVSSTQQRKPRWQLQQHLDSSSLSSSPDVPAPQLRAEIFDSPLKRHQARVMREPRTPGVSVQTPGGKGGRGGDSRYRYGERDDDDEDGKTGGGAGAAGRKQGSLWDDDDYSDEDEFLEELGFSPPKTIQFHVPQSRLLQTPAREAAKGIVENLLMTAGGEITDDDRTEGDSPSVVRRHEEMDETF